MTSYFKNNKYVTLQWIHTHCTVQGNEIELKWQKLPQIFSETTADKFIS